MTVNTLAVINLASEARESRLTQEPDSPGIYLALEPVLVSVLLTPFPMQE